jgi:hypothetical protein
MHIERLTPAAIMAMWLACCLALLSGCAVKLIADYDPKTDEAVTQLHHKFESFFVDLESQVGSEEAEYRHHVRFYKDIRVDVSALKLRASAIPMNEITLKQIAFLEENIALLEEIHKEGIADIEVVQVPRDDFNTALSNILKLELAKRR